VATNSKFGRVDAENNVFVIEGAAERRVGQYPNVTPEEALAFYERKFGDLEAQVRILEQRVTAGADAHSLKKNLTTLNAELVEPNVVGDIAELRTRVAAVAGKVDALVRRSTKPTRKRPAQH
jgi:hypothetical protein